MELALPLIALGGMYVISNNNGNNGNNGNKKTTHTTKDKHKDKYKESFQTMNNTTQLPNTNIPPQNYPITNNRQLIDNVQEYPNPNQATDKYFNQNVYENKDRQGMHLDSHIQNFYSLTGEYMNTNMFTHNNMTPFNGAKPRGQVYNNNINESVLDNYVGSGSQVIKKIEQAPLFKPQENV